MPLRSSLVLGLALLGAPPDVLPRDADPTHDAMRLQREALAGDDPDAFRVCGEAALAALAELPPGDPRIPATRQRAGDCYQRAGLWDAAVVQYERLIADAPASDEAQRATLTLADGFAARARFAEALRHCEQFVRTYPHSPHLRTMLSATAELQHALGRDDLAFASLAALELSYSHAPEAAAEVHWSRRAWLTDDDARLAHAEAYLARHGRSSARDRTLVAEATRARILWDRACDKGSVLGLCAILHAADWRGKLHLEGPRNYAAVLRARKPVPPQTPRPPERRCDRQAEFVESVFPRNRRHAATAQRRFAMVVRGAADIDIPADQLERRREFADAVAMARVHLADLDLEDLLASSSPPPEFLLAADPARQLAATRRIADYLKSSDTRASRLIAAYTPIATDDEVPAWSVVASHRLALVTRIAADQLRTAVLPVGLDDARFTAHCQALETSLAPRRAVARAALERCLDRAVQLPWFGRDDHARDCERQLTRLDPRAYPPLAEIVNIAQYTASTPETIGVQHTAPDPPFTQLHTIDTPSNPQDSPPARLGR